MSLSVSGFPEPSRQATHSSEIFSSNAGDSPQDGHGKATLINSPRLRGLFGASATPSTNTSNTSSSSSKKPDATPKRLRTTSKSDTEGDPHTYAYAHAHHPSSPQSQSSAIRAGITMKGTTPPATPSLAFAATPFEPLPQQEYELGLELEALPHPHPLPNKRAQLPPLPRKVTPSPVRLGPNLARLKIVSSWGLSQPQPQAYAQSKSPPPSVVVHEWKGTNVGDGSGSGNESGNGEGGAGNAMGADGAASNVIAQKSSASASSRPLPSVPVVAAPRHVNAVAGPSTHANALRIPPTASSSSSLSTSPSSSGSPSSPPSSSATSVSLSPTSAVSPPTSKVIILQPTPQRAHKPHTHSLSMRYQPLVAEPTESSSSNSTSTSSTTQSPVRPLPRIPPSSSPSPQPAPSTSAQFYPPPPRVKRPKTSPNPITEFTPTPSTSRPIPAGNMSSSLSSLPPRSTQLAMSSPRHRHTSTWGARPGVNWHTAQSQSSVSQLTTQSVKQRANSPPPPLPISSNGKVLGTPRARSLSRTRTGASLEATGGATWVGMRPSAGMGSTSPTIAGARPLPKKAPTIPAPVLHVQTKHRAKPVLPSSASSANGVIRSLPLPTLVTRLPPATSFSTSASAAASPRTSPKTGSLVVNALGGCGTPRTPIAISITTTVTTTTTGANSPVTAGDNTDDEDMYVPDTLSILDSPLHTHPLGADTHGLLTDTESVSHSHAYPHSHSHSKPHIDPNLLSAPVSPTSATDPDSPLEVFVDDHDLSTLPPWLARGPSPIRYARPDSRGRLRGEYTDLGEDEDVDEGEGSDVNIGGGLRVRGRQKGKTRGRGRRNNYDGYDSTSSSSGYSIPGSSTSSRNGSTTDSLGIGVRNGRRTGPRRRRRTEQLRSYRHSYRPKARASSPSEDNDIDNSFGRETFAPVTRASSVSPSR
ncbi:hypothetical protein JR316_0010284 [Psilocybe cubensis]|uniref:Uncharacterized protein n=2 Tax=Psilocybe cubensis TaxID=181762 RepID=A0A8H7XSG7_PSICU|nr:hypothetical protein JR316_0010284 [Psilocybe cubensis]KAH9478047.1 hypothetical protein JR316_0010284 [Psilocybe cubensis]